MEQSLMEVFLRLVDSRTAAVEQHNISLWTLLAPTLLAGIEDLIDVRGESVKWLDLTVEQNLIVVLMQATYDVTQPMTPALASFTPTLDGGPAVVERKLKFCVPLDMVFSPKEEITAFLDKYVKIATQVTAPAQVEAPAPFDIKTLSGDQLRQLLLTSQLISGKLQ